MAQRHIMSILAIGATCAVVGAGISGIASSSAATPTAGTAAAQAAPPGDALEGPGGGPHRGGGHGGGMGGPDGGGIHAESVRADPDGTGFITTVSDAGTVSSIDGSMLTVQEGTANETLDTVKVTIDGTVNVERNGVTAKLADIKVGDHVRISTDGTTTRVHASTAAFEKSQSAARAQEQQDRAATMTWPAA